MSVVASDDWLYDGVAMYDELYDEDFIMHIGTPHEGNIPHSGRFPYGSGEHAYQRYHDFYHTVLKYRAQGMNDRDICMEMGVVNRFGQPDVNKFKARWSNATNAEKAIRRDTARRLYEECNHNASEVARRMNLGESTIRNYLNEAQTARVHLNERTADILKDYVDKYHYVDISDGSEIYLGCTKTRLNNAVERLEQDGYKLQTLYIQQQGTGHKTTVNVLTSPDVDYGELVENKYSVRFPGQDTRVVDENWDLRKIGADTKPTTVSSSRVMVRYNEEGGLDKDGLIELRPGVADLSLGGARYAQVRINVDDSHFLKGMAVYNDNMPPGVDVIFNTNKHVGTPAMLPPGAKGKEVFKPLERDKNGEVNWANPFGAATQEPITTMVNDSIGVQSACNIVRREGQWMTWDKNLAAQFLSKQPVALAERQLKTSVDDRTRELEEIKSLTNPEVKKALLSAYASKVDALAVDLKAAPFAGQQTHVIIPVPELKDNEIYAPNYTDGTRVALVRYPHQGTFEIATCTVRNTGSPAEKIIPKAIDAVGINHNVADRLSGADFDGDTVVVIPLSDKVKIRTHEPLELLKGFDPKEEYAGYEGMPVMSEHTKQLEMGKISNLVTDMTVQAAPYEDIAYATRHAQVVIDAAKHKLDWRRSYVENHIEELKDRYQSSPDGTHGASTIISRAGAETLINARKDWYESKGTIGPNGEKIFKETGETYLRGTLKGIPLNDGTLVKVRTEKGTGKRYYTKDDAATGKKVRVYVTDDDFPDTIDTLMDNRKVIVNKDKKSGQLYYLRDDPSTGKKVRVYTKPEDFVGDTIHEELRQVKSTRMAETSDAYTLTSGGSKENPGYEIEGVYAKFANDMKHLGNEARLAYINTDTQKRDPEATRKYSAEVESLKKKVLDCKARSPLERQAQLLAGRNVAMARAADPNMDKDELSSLRGRYLDRARTIVTGGVRKPSIKPTPREWEAIENNAVSATLLRDIMKYSDLDYLRQLATPKAQRTVTPAMDALAKSMAASGYSQSDIADRLGVSSATVNRILHAELTEK